MEGDAMIRPRVSSWQRKLLLCSLAAAGIGLVAGFGFYSRMQAPVLLFERPEIDLRQNPAFEGEPVDVVAKLHNFGNLSLRITQMVPS